ncbi:hypothetical protein G6F70_008774 [Rhizopus microsporus]|uniref:DUF926-domain-containing protein n=1 Tax=Rhizopus microsporus TaxID=58291 RepID=A0A1X0RP00_RHIZD|nr:hypothetical protein G6F71_008733 [Rhizopus microsporus]KAG1194738.1 hypothetical protein G6F70_008774 [Rhizopus microsporus]KAG1206556.1 hypothetical protein G6F69_008746 [Rhizopus microsporus]KAG1231572.1 hypothetical protein G6F67_005657 [Rhizopus microsporus]KAG1258581.1 hypothetical protein G6F68_008685 [Rhizopus microsporus]
MSERSRHISPSPERHSKRYYSRYRSDSREYEKGDSRDRRQRSDSRDYSPRRTSRDYSPRRRRSVSRDQDSRRRRSVSRDEDSRRKRYSRHQQELKPINNIPILPGESFSDYRTRVRNESTVTIWAPSPERPRSVSPEERRRKRSISYSDDTSSDEEEERRRKRKKHHKHKKSKKRSSKKHKKKRYSDTESESLSESEKEEEPVKILDKSQLEASEDLWVEKQVDLPQDLAPIGPVPLIENGIHNERQYGSALLPGEGSAMAAYVQQGKRIPRRGEIGLSGDQIAEFEKAGYVMSGSRHQRMNAVRLRKENQVISAEEKRLVLQHAQEQKLRRENEIISGFREILGEKLKKE